MAYKSVKIKGFLQKMWHTDPKTWHTNPPLLCHMNRFYGGWGGGLQFVDNRNLRDYNKVADSKICNFPKFACHGLSKKNALLDDL